MNEPSNKHCVVVGGGVAGMSAAMACAERGTRVTLLEARPYLGGRAHSFTETTTGEHIDNGQHLMMGCYHSFLRLLRFLGTDSLLEWQPQLTVHFRDTTGVRDTFSSKMFGGSLGALEALLRMRSVSWRAKWRAAMMMARIQMGANARSEESTLNFLQRHRQDVTMIHRFWEPLILATLNASVQQADAQLLVEVLRRSILAGTKESTLLIARRGLSALFEPFTERLRAHGGRVQLRTEVDALRVAESGGVILELKSGESIQADAVVLALPPRALLRLLEGNDNHVLHSPANTTEPQNSPIVSVYLWLDRDFMEEDFCAAVGTTIQWVFNRRRLCDSAEELKTRLPGHLTLTISAADRIVGARSEDIVATCLSELHQLFPASREAQLLHSKVIKEKSATIRAQPHTRVERLSVTTGIPQVSIAGDWTDTKLPATLEGAAQSGIEAATQVLLTLR